MQADLKKFLELLDRRRTKYQLVDQQRMEDGAIVIRLKKRYNAYKTDGYID